MVGIFSTRSPAATRTKGLKSNPLRELPYVYQSIVIDQNEVGLYHRRGSCCGQAMWLPTGGAMKACKIYELNTAARCAKADEPSVEGSTLVSTHLTVCDSVRNYQKFHNILDLTYLHQPCQLVDLQLQSLGATCPHSFSWLRVWPKAVSSPRPPARRAILRTE